MRACSISTFIFGLSLACMPVEFSWMEKILQAITLDAIMRIKNNRVLRSLLYKFLFGYTLGAGAQGIAQ